MSFLIYFARKVITLKIMTLFAEITAWVMSIAAIVFDICSSLTKGDKSMVKILIFTFSSNLTIALSYLVKGEGINGSISCFLGATICLINFFYNYNKRKIPVYMTLLYAIAFTSLNIWSGGINFDSIVAILACLCFVMSVVQDTGKMFRIWTLTNCVLWIVYDFIVATYEPLFTHVVLTAFFIAGIIINDRKQIKE